MYDEMIPRNHKYPGLPPAPDRVRIISPVARRVNAAAMANNNWPGYLDMYFNSAPHHMAQVIYKSAAGSTIEVLRNEIPKAINLPGPEFTLHSNPVIVGADRNAYFGPFDFQNLSTELQTMIYKYCFTIAKTAKLPPAREMQDGLLESRKSGAERRIFSQRGRYIQATAQLLYTCKTIYADARPIFYQCITIHPESLGSFPLFRQIINQEKLKLAAKTPSHHHIRRLELPQKWFVKAIHAEQFAGLRDLRVVIMTGYQLSVDSVEYTMKAPKEYLDVEPFSRAGVSLKSRLGPTTKSSSGKPSPDANEFIREMLRRFPELKVFVDVSVTVRGRLNGNSRVVSSSYVQLLYIGVCC